MRSMVQLLLLLTAGWTVVSANSRCPARCFCFATTVRCMFLHLDSIPEVPPGTTTLDLRFNDIAEISANAFQKSSTLSTLLLNNNAIKRLEDGAFKGLAELRYLYLYKNSIKVIERNAFQGVKKLEQIYLHFNEIEDLLPETFSDLPKLERLFLHNNKLAHVPIGAFRNITSLRRLRLDSNALICDCQMLWLADMLKKTQGTTQAAATCKYPKVLEGKSLMTLKMAELNCKKPVLMEEPNDVELTSGGTVYFSCKAAGDPQPDIVWLRDNNEISHGSTFQTERFSLLEDGTLMIEDAQESDQGVYECMAKNPLGEVKSRKAKMRRQVRDEDQRSFLRSSTSHNINNNNVILRGNRAPAISRTFQPLEFTIKPRDQTVNNGSTFLLECQVSGDPRPTILWTHNDLPITDTFRTLISTEVNNRLRISNARKQDAGTYRCTATNANGQVSASATVNVQAPPTVLEAPVDQIVEIGDNAVFFCRVDGDPFPTITWIRKGQVLTANSRISISGGGTRVFIRSVEKSDQTTYLCRAQNIAGTSDAGADLIIQDRAAPTFVELPQNVNADVGGTAKFACGATGSPTPRVSWRHDGAPLENGLTFRIDTDGTLTIDSVVESDHGQYECRAENDLGVATSAAFLSIQQRTSHGTSQTTGGFGGISDVDIRQSVEQANRIIGKAVNNTLRNLFETHRSPQGPADLMRLIRFPAPHVQNSIRAAEVYERALLFVRQYVREGHTFNLTSDMTAVVDLDLSEENMWLMANLSGCLAHRRTPDCSDWCFHSKYRTYDATCNNLQHPLWGASETALRRLLNPVYENGFNTPVGWTSERLLNGFELPAARQVSNTVIRASTITPADDFTHMLMQWGQFLDHDLDLAPPTVSTESFLEGTNCQFSCSNAPPCFPIPIPDDDPRITTRRCMEFVRTSPACGSGATSVLYGRAGSRDQLNVLTSYIDGSQVYGSSSAEALHLRQRGGEPDGFLRLGTLVAPGKHLLPFNENWPVDCRRDTRESGVGCFVAGDTRVNEQLALIAMHTVWFREHNRLAARLKALNGQWDDERVYQEARKIVGAKIQHVTYAHWLPSVLGPKGIALLGQYRGYDPALEAGISNEFATAALRFGHTLINPILHRLNATLQPIPQGHIHLRNAFFSPFRILEEGGVDPLLRGLYAVPTKLKMPDQLLNSELTEQLFRQVNHVPLDLAAINIQRGRDHGLPSYNEYRRWCNLTVARTFRDLQQEISNLTLRNKLKSLYGHPGNIDLWVGGVSEDVVEGAKVGPTFLCILVDQFRRLRDGDRFYYENPDVFKPEHLAQVKQASLARVLCDNGDNITNITMDVFTLANKQPSGYVSCDRVPSEDLTPWRECCQACGHTPTVSRSRRQVDEYSYSSDRPKRQISPEEAPWSTESSFDAAKGHSEDLMDVNEERLEGIEEVIQTLGNTAKQLIAEINKLKRRCPKVGRNTPSGCTAKDGRKWKEGEKWMMDRCSHCTCTDRQITCEVQSDCRAL